MKIDGIDPLLLNRLQEQASRQEVKPAEGARFDTPVKDREKAEARVLPPEGSKSTDSLAKALQKLNDTAEAFQLSLRFQKHQASERWMVRVVDSENRVLREIPPEQVLNIVAQIHDLIGILLDEQR